MDFKKLFRKDDKAVSPVIGVILMVAITVILAAAIGSSVFSHGTAKSAPQANFDIKPAGIDTDKTPDLASVRIEHLGGDPIHFEGTSPVTKVMASVNGGTSVQVKADGLNTLGVGDVQKLALKTAAEDTSGIRDTSTATTDDIKTGDTVNIKIIDVQTNQIICDKDVRF